MHSLMAPLVSVVIPAYIATPRQEELLEETLSTVDRQTFTDYEVVVVDDGSPIDVARLAGAHSRTTAVRQENGGSAIARNTGIGRSRGEFLVFLDADDHLLPQGLQAGLQAFATHPEAGFVVGPREEMTYEGQPVPWPVPPPPEQTQLYLPLLGFDWYIIPPSSAMFRRAIVERAGGFQDPWGADDLDFYLRVARTASAWCYQEPAVTRYRRYSTSSSRDGERMLHSVRTVYDRQRPLVKDDPEAEAAFRRGLERLTEIFLDCVAENVQDRVRAGDDERARRSARLLAAESPARWQRLVSEGVIPPERGDSGRVPR